MRLLSLRWLEGVYEIRGAPAHLHRDRLHPKHRDVFRKHTLALTIMVVATFHSATSGQVKPATVTSLRLIGSAHLPGNTVASGPLVGGLSSLDYDAAADRWLAVSDDRSDHAPARYYTLRIDYSSDGVRGMAVQRATFFRQENGTLYTNGRDVVSAGGEVPDCEALRIDPRDDTLWYTSEGDGTRRTDPWVRHTKRDGTFLGSMPLPALFKFDPAGRVGARPNLNFEGLSFTPDGENLWLAMEAPLVQDGALPSGEAGANVRFTLLSRRGEIRRQVVYPIDESYLRPAPGKLASNGVSEALAVSEKDLLVL